MGLDGTFNGGGGGANSDFGGAAGGGGGFGGGGGGASVQSYQATFDIAFGGNGGFGGGGGAGNKGQGGAGGFGGGGGGTTVGPAGSGGFAGGSASGTQGGGGAALGGSVFVQAGGNLSIKGNTTETGSNVTGGTAGSSNGGQAYGQAIFVQGPANGGTTTLGFADGDQSIDKSIADYIGSGGQNPQNPFGRPDLADQGGKLALSKSGSGTLTLSGANTYSGGTTLSGATTLDLNASTTVNGNGNITSGAAGTGGINFGVGAQSLRIESKSLSNTTGAPTLAYTLTGFSNDGDLIDLRNIDPKKASVSSYNVLENTLTINDGKNFDTLQFAKGSLPANTQFSVASDGQTTGGLGTNVFLVATLAPSISGTTAGQTTAAETTIPPFQGVTIGDTNAGATDTLTISLSGTGGGTLTDGTTFSGLTHNQDGSYTLKTDTALNVTNELDALVFKPTAGAPGSQTTTTFTLSDKSSAYSTAAVDSKATVIDAAATVAPSISGTTAGQTTAAETTIPPFQGVTIGDTNAGATDTLTISLSGTGGGTLTDGTTFSGLTHNQDGSYTLKTDTALNVTNELDALVFKPTAGAPGSQTTTTFTLSDKSSAYSTAAVDSKATVIDAAATVAPSISGTTAGQTTAAETTIPPFQGVTIGDTNAGATDTLTISLSGTGGGTLTDGTTFSGLTHNQDGSYTLKTDTALNVTNELDALVFKPTAGAPGSQTTTTFTLSDKSSAYSTAAVDSKATVIDAAATVAPSISGTTAGQTTAAETTIPPFQGVTIGDTNAGATDTLTISLSGTGGGTLTDGTTFSGLTHNQDGSYTLKTDTALNVTNELDALVFKPTAGAPGSQTTTTFTLSDKSSAYHDLHALGQEQRL